MAKAGFQCMKAVEQFAEKEGYGSIGGWTVSGASKRGWTAWMVGAATCASCPTVLGIAPLVPIVPALHKARHCWWSS